MTRTTHVSAYNRGANLNDASAKRDSVRQVPEWKHEKLFHVNEHITFGCDTKKTRNGTRELATLYIDGVPQGSGSYFWSNRPWQEYTYHDAMTDALEKANVTPTQYEEAKAFLKRDQTDYSIFKTTRMVAALGDVFGQTQKEKNDWKVRMLKAGLADKGLEMPDDWDTLSEDEKTRRLDAVMEQLKTP